METQHNKKRKLHEDSPATLDLEAAVIEPAMASDLLEEDDGAQVDENNPLEGMENDALSTASSPLSSRSATPSLPDNAFATSQASDLALEDSKVNRYEYLRSPYPVIHVFRHGQSHHKPDEDNFGKSNTILEDLKDPGLTVKGASQCRIAGKNSEKLQAHLSQIWTCSSNRCVDSVIAAFTKLIIEGSVRIYMMAELSGMDTGLNGQFKDFKLLKRLYGSTDKVGTHPFAGRISVNGYLYEGYNDPAQRNPHAWHPSGCLASVHKIEQRLRGVALIGKRTHTRPEVFISTHGSLMRSWFGDDVSIAPATIMTFRWCQEKMKWVLMTEEELAAYREWTYADESDSKDSSE